MHGKHRTIEKRRERIKNTKMLSVILPSPSQNRITIDRVSVGCSASQSSKVQILRGSVGLDLITTAYGLGGLQGLRYMEINKGLFLRLLIFSFCFFAKKGFCTIFRYCVLTRRLSQGHIVHGRIEYRLISAPKLFIKACSWK